MEWAIYLPSTGHSTPTATSSGTCPIYHLQAGSNIHCWKRWVVDAVQYLAHLIIRCAEGRINERSTKLHNISALLIELYKRCRALELQWDCPHKKNTGRKLDIDNWPWLCFVNKTGQAPTTRKGSLHGKEPFQHIRYPASAYRWCIILLLRTIGSQTGWLFFPSHGKVAHVHYVKPPCIYLVYRAIWSRQPGQVLWLHWNTTTTTACVAHLSGTPPNRTSVHLNQICQVSHHDCDCTWACSYLRCVFPAAGSPQFAHTWMLASENIRKLELLRVTNNNMFLSVFGARI